MKRKLLSLLMLLMTAATGAWAQGYYNININFDPVYNPEFTFFMCDVMGPDMPSGTLDLSIDNSYTGSFRVDNGMCSSEIHSLDAGDHTWYAEFIPDGGGEKSTEERSFTIDQGFAYVYIDDPGQSSIEMGVGESRNFRGHVDGPESSEVNISSSNDNVAKFRASSSFSYGFEGYIDAVGAGTATITVSFAGNKNYKAAQSKTLTVTVNPAGPTVIASGNCGTSGHESEVTWTLTSDGVLTISGTGAMADYSPFDLPTWYSNASSITSIVINEGVTHIGVSAFSDCNNANLTSITIPSSVTSIGYGAFLQCTSLTSITIPASVASIGGQAFYNCINLTSVTVYASSCALGDNAFEECTNLAHIFVPAGSMTTYMTNWSAYESKFVGMLSETEGITNAIATDIAGKPVSFNRTFSAGVASTVCLPFAMTGLAENTVYEMTSMDKSGDTWTATMTNVTETEASKPYLFKASADGAVSFSGTVANGFNGTAGTSSATYNGDGSWTFRGTYTTLTYGTNLTGAVYGFAGAAYGLNSVKAGDFVKAETGAYVSPFRCYLTYNAPSSARGMTRGADIELPSRIIVRLVDSNGQTTAIGSMDTRTGEVSFDSDAWYSLDGRKLNGKPTKKGMYINNGRKMIIK